MHTVDPARHRGAHKGAPLEAFSRTEKIIAFCRVLLALATTAIVIVDPKQPSFAPDVAVVVLVAYLLYSVVLFVLVRGEHVRQERVGAFSAAADIVWVSFITIFTERGASPFFMLHVFLISSVSVRWGLAATVRVTVLLAALYPAVMWFAGHILGSDDLVLHRAHLVRPVYLLVIGYLIGYLGEHERRSKRKLGLLLDLTSVVRRTPPTGRTLTQLMRRVLRFFDAQQTILVLRDPESGRYFTWSVTRRSGHVRVGLRITEDDPYALPFAAESEGFVANDLRPGRRSALCYDVITSGITRRAIPADVPLPGDGAQALLVAPVLIQRTLRGRAVVARETRRKFTRDDLEFLLVLVGQAAAGFETVRLQTKAEEVAVLEERARIARDLHDGFIQALAGIDLRVEACKLHLQRDPSRVPRELEELHQAVDRGYREVRHYLTVLRTASRQADDFGTTLDRLAAEFSIRERLRVYLSRPPADPGLPTSTAYELTQIVREALHNAVRHGRATQAIVKLAARPSHVYLVVRDNGQGFNGNGSVDPDGFLAPAASPWSIRERAAALGGSLRVWTRPNEGAEISLMIPVSQGGSR
ncbi:MAG TPA: histidine kinase [Candidatus Eisenbacteria bacterium]|nr:histidine kinase [Candidatus Eisenbacteria bacterium]